MVIPEHLFELVCVLFRSECKCRAELLQWRQGRLARKRMDTTVSRTGRDKPMLIENESRENRYRSSQLNSGEGGRGEGEAETGEDEMRLRDQSAYEVKREDSAQLRGGKKRSEGLKKGKGNKEANDVFGDGRRGRQSVRGRKTGSLVKYTGRLRGPHGWLGARGEQCWAAAGQLAGAKPSPGPDQVLWEPSKLGEATRYMPVGPRGRPPPCAMHCFLFGAGWKHASGQDAGQRWSAD
jgi:hypothetical protein